MASDCINDDNNRTVDITSYLIPKEPIDIKEVINAQAIAITKLQPETCQVLIYGAKELLLRMKKKAKKNQAKKKKKKQKTGVEDPKLDFITVAGIDIRILGKCERSDMTKRRFMALLHRKLFESSVQECGKPFMSPLIKKIGLPESVENNAEITLVGSGMEFNHELFKSKELMWFGALLLDYSSYRRTCIKSNVPYLEILEFFSDESIPMWTIIGLVRQTKADISSVDALKIKEWLNGCSFDARKSFSNRKVTSSDLSQFL